MKFATSSTLLVLALACFAVTGCSKDKKDDGDAAADATVEVDAAVVDAAPEASADLDAAADSAVAPLATVAKPVAKPKVDPPICASARSAKLKKSPAAPNLEKQCIAAGGTM